MSSSFPQRGSTRRIWTSALAAATVSRSTRTCRRSARWRCPDLRSCLTLAGSLYTLPEATGLCPCGSQGARPMSPCRLLPILVVLLGAAPDEPDVSGPVVPPGARLEKVWGEGSFTEGGALAADGSI